MPSNEPNSESLQEACAMLNCRFIRLYWCHFVHCFFYNSVECSKRNHGQSPNQMINFLLCVDFALRVLVCAGHMSVWESRQKLKQRSSFIKNKNFLSAISERVRVGVAEKTTMVRAYLLAVAIEHKLMAWRSLMQFLWIFIGEILSAYKTL